MDKWRELEEKIKKLGEVINTLIQKNKELNEKIKLLETECKAVLSLRAERDNLRNEKEAVIRRVKEMLQQVEKVKL